MACQVPVVASRVGGLPELVDDGVTGFLHAPEDLDGMAASAIRLLTTPELHRAAAEAARRTAVERYSEARIVPLYEQYYTEILAAPSRV
jgi:glycosyltransferase involved in cell wall biosynthesis